MRSTLDSRRDTCSCPLEDDRPTGNGADETPPGVDPDWADQLVIPWVQNSSGLRLDDLPPRFAPQLHWTPDGGVHE
jgi:hypothetical protein